MIGRQIAIGFGIAILFPLLIFYGVSTFGSPPRFSDYSATQSFDYATATPEERAANREKQKTAQKNFHDAESQFAMRLFYASAPLGFAAILIGGFMAVSTVGTGLIFGGIFAVINGYWHYWEFIPDWQRFASLLIATAVLILIASRKLPKGSGA